MPNTKLQISEQEAFLKLWYFYSVLTVVTWGLWGLFSKLASNYSKPKQALLFQTAGVLAFAIVVLFMEKFRFEWSVPGFSWAALGGFFAFIGFLTFFAALDQGKASSVVTLSALYPLVTILLSILFLHERLTPRQGIGIVFALIASVLLAA
jgi:bacterial/archaeal transporter family protein